jgi:hypoxanthine phosphoribosyltransferase
MKSEMMRFLTYADLENAVAALGRPLAAYLVKDSGLKWVITGEPRGGLPLAVALSHKLGVDFLSQEGIPEQYSVLWIDDILDSGRTLEAARLRYSHHSRLVLAVWVTKKPNEPVHSVLAVDPKTWIVFPWEDGHKARADRMAYLKSRGGK